MAVPKLDKIAATWRWRQWAIILFAPVVTGLLVWQLQGLDPKYWCGVVDDRSLDGAGLVAKLNACIQLQIAILNIKDHAIVGLLCVLGLMVCLFMVTEFRTRLKAHGPMGTSVDIGGPKGDGE